MIRLSRLPRSAFATPRSVVAPSSKSPAERVVERNRALLEGFIAKALEGGADADAALASARRYVPGFTPLRPLI